MQTPDKLDKSFSVIALKFLQVIDSMQDLI